MSTIDDLKRKVQSLNDQLESAKASLCVAMIAESPIKVGDVVRSMGGTERKVSRLEAKYSTVSMYGYKRKGNGEWGARESYIGYVGDSWCGWKAIR